jgi:hypothetical protein
MDDSSPPPVFVDDEDASSAPHQHIDPVPSAVDAAAERWRDGLLSSDPTNQDEDFADHESDPRPEGFLRVWPEDGPKDDRPREAAWWSPLFSVKALQGAVIANGGALVALALLMAAPENGPKTGLMASAVVLGLGLMFAAISVVASLNFRDAQLRLAQIATASWLATISGAVSYAALPLAAFPLILIAR